MIIANQELGPSGREVIDCKDENVISSSQFEICFKLAII